MSNILADGIPSSQVKAPDAATTLLVALPYSAPTLGQMCIVRRSAGVSMVITPGGLGLTEWNTLI